MITAWKEITLELPTRPVTIVIAADETAVVGLRFGSSATQEGWLGSAPSDPLHPLLEDAASQLRGYACGEEDGFELPLRLSGTEFQRAVWSALQDIPYGSTSTYGKVAAVIGRPTSTRAVGAAIGANPVGIVVPCHRVIGANGSLTGFAGGLDNKLALLSREGVTAF